MKRILVADDDIDIRDMVERIIQSMGHECVLVEGGEAAINAYAMARHTECAFDLLVLDLAMPYTNGFAVAEKIRESGDQETPILFVTGYGESAKSRARSYSDLEVFAKPFEVCAFMAYVQGILGEHL